MILAQAEALQHCAGLAQAWLSHADHDTPLQDPVEDRLDRVVPGAEPDSTADPGFLDQRLGRADNNVGPEPPDLDPYLRQLRLQPGQRGRADHAQLHLIEVGDIALAAYPDVRHAGVVA